MKNLIAVILACMCALTTSAFAQSPSGATQEWSGRYYGVSAGYVSGTPNHNWSGNLPGVDIDVNGAAIGLTYGKNYHLENMVAGYELDLNVSNSDGYALMSGFPQSVPCLFPNEGCSNQLEAFATFRARVGIPLQNGFLPFVTGGLAVGKIDATADLGACSGAPGTGICELDELLLGWTVGIGVEKMLDSGWSVKAEYTYMDFGEEIFDGSTAPSSIVTGDFQYSLIKIGLNRHF